MMLAYIVRPLWGYRVHTAVCIVLAAGTEIQANMQFNIFILLQFLAFTGGAPWVHFWLPPIKWG